MCAGESASPTQQRPEFLHYAGVCPTTPAPQQSLRKYVLVQYRSRHHCRFRLASACCLPTPRPRVTSPFTNRDLAHLSKRLRLTLPRIKSYLPGGDVRRRQCPKVRLKQVKRLWQNRLGPVLERKSLLRCLFIWIVIVMRNSNGL